VVWASCWEEEEYEPQHSISSWLEISQE
jgi:hypothetical protein